MVLKLELPSTVNLTQYSDVQRGTIFVWLFSIFILTIMTGIRVATGQMENGRGKYDDKKK